MTPPEFKSYRLPDGKPMRCVVCAHERFEERILWIRDRTPGSVFEALANAGGRPVQAAVCESCGYVHLFLRE